MVSYAKEEYSFQCSAKSTRCLISQSLCAGSGAFPRQRSGRCSVPADHLIDVPQLLRIRRRRQQVPRPSRLRIFKSGIENQSRREGCHFYVSSCIVHSEYIHKASYDRGVIASKKSLKNVVKSLFGLMISLFNTDIRLNKPWLIFYN